MTITSIIQTNDTPEGKYARWKDEITSAEKELGDWHEQGGKIVKRYVDERNAMEADARKFNIFTANVGILKSALYSKIPDVDVDRKFKDADDDVARVAALIMQRAITQDLDVPDSYFSQVMTECIEDRLVPGLGQAWVRLETDTEDTEEMDEEGVPVKKIVNQRLIAEHVFWKDFLWSPCRTWSERRWVGRRVYMDRDSLVARFGEETGKIIPLDYSPKTDKSDQSENDILSKAIVYEIWDRQTRSVVWLSKAHPELLDTRDDPLGLDSFEPCPRPMFALTTTTKCVPVPDYAIIQDQYKELDDVNNRISLLVAACKVVGVYDRSSDGVQRMMNEGVDNTLVPVDNWAMFAEKGGIKGQIDWLPLDAVIQALERLRTAREDIKMQIYELTGISDIARGVSKASETLGAQQIKAQFASIRIQELQDSVANFASAIFRIKAQLLAKHFTPEMLLKLSGIEHTPDAKTNPDLIVEAIRLIKNQQEFTWRVTVDADSMKMADYAAEKEERSAFITSVATYLQSASTMVKESPAMAPLLIEMLKYAAASQRGSKVLEGVMDSTLEKVQAELDQASANPPPNPEQQKMAVEKQKAELTQQSEMMKLDFKRQAQELDNRMKMQEMAMQQRQNQMDLDFQARKQEMDLFFRQRTMEMDLQNKAREEAAKETPETPEQPTQPAVAPVINIGSGKKSASIVRDASGRISGINIDQGE